MERKRALLVVAGGRSLPDILALFQVKPHLVVILTSEEGWHAEEKFVSAANSMVICEKICYIRNVNAYKLEAGKKACMDACEPYPDTKWEWTFSIVSGPKITSIAAFEVAKERNIPCLFVDTTHEKIVEVAKDLQIEVGNLFHMDVPDYLHTQGRTYRQHKGKSAEYRNIIEAWGHIARELALSPDAPKFILHMRDQPFNKEIALPQDLVASPLIQSLAVSHRLIQVRLDKSGNMVCLTTSHEAALFLGKGDWLEIYVWDEARKANFTDDCQWGYQIIDGKAKNELDLVATYKAQLIIGECKTDFEPFSGKRSYLEALDANANLLGGTFVTKIFITNQPQTRIAYAEFKEQADKRRILVVTGEDITNIGAILKREALTPTYPRV